MDSSSFVKYSWNTSNGDSGMKTVGPTEKMNSCTFTATVSLVHDVGKAATNRGEVGSESWREEAAAE